ncbi:13164_t:CDS:1, partial [Gigaspora margarita]
MFEIAQMEANKSTDSTNFKKGSVLEPKIVERPQKSQKIITNNKTILSKKARTKIIQKSLESELTNEFALKVYSSQTLSHAHADQGPATTGSKTFKYRKDDLIDMDIKGFTTI